MSAKDLKQVLTIAGSDSSGGAGIQADLKTFASLHTYGSSVITALTAQNTKGVEAVEASSADFVAKQLHANLSDLDIKCAKTGMLANTGIIKAVAEGLRQYPTLPLIIDPVMVSTSGHTLLETEAISTLKELLLPLATVVTPNLPEGFILAGKESSSSKEDTSMDTMQDICRIIASQGPSFVLLKGGHATSEGVLDIFYDKHANSFSTFKHQRINTKNTHGTGCTLSAAICAYMAKGFSPLDSVQKGIEYVNIALYTSTDVGAGSGPVNHLHPTTLKCLDGLTPEKPTPFTTHLISSCKADWEEYVWDNAFVQGIRDGTLPPAAFVHFLKQDYIFLKHYARVFAVSIYKAETFDEMRVMNERVGVILREVRMHEKYCERFGTAVSELEREEMGTVAYTRYVLDIAHSRSMLHLQVATSPCSIGYAEIGRRLLDDPQTKRGDENPYWTWIQEYGSDWFQASAQESLEQMEELAQRDVFLPEHLKDLCRVFETATRMESAFFKQSVSPLTNKELES